MSEKYMNFIGGEWVAASTGKWFENRNPADRTDLVGLFADGDARDVEAAVAAAARGFETWRLLPAPKRAESVLRAGERLVERKEAFARDMTREMGKILDETRGDVQEAIDTAFYAAGEGRRMFGDTVPVELPDKFGMSVRCPVGVFAIVTPWNFPMAIPSWKIFPALVCGNTVVFKPASDTPLSAVNFVRTLADAGVPPGVVNLVTGGGRAVGSPLVEHPRVRGVSFTGSTEVGRTIAEGAGKRLKRCSLELGGKNAQLVLEDADLDLAVDGAVWGAFATAGQRCTATSRAIVHERVISTFTERLVARVERLKLGPGLDPGTEMGPLVNEGQLKTVEHYVRVGLDEGATRITGGERPGGGAFEKGWFYEPTVFTNVRPDMRIAQEEIFGPVLSVLRCGSLEEGLAILNGTAYGLSSSIYTRDVSKAFRAVREIEAGIVYVNGPTIGAEVQLPFGGVKDTGNGHREAGRAVLDVFTEWKSVYVDYSGRLQRAQIDSRKEA